MLYIELRCPNCGRILQADGNKDANICPFCQKAYVTEKAIKCYENFKTRLSLSSPNNQQTSCLGDVFRTKAILEKAYLAERNMYVISSTITAFNNKRDELQREYNSLGNDIEKPILKSPMIEGIRNNIFVMLYHFIGIGYEMAGIFGIINFFVSFIICAFPFAFFKEIFRENGIQDDFVILPSLLVLLIPSVIKGVIVSYKNKVASYEYDYQLKVLEEDRQENLNKQNYCKQQVAMLSKSKAETQKILDYVYSFNVIHRKYQNLCAVSMIYEYLDTGRCDTLEGTYGAYNIYENEIRNNIIISRLDTIISQLNQIRHTQHMIYEAINYSQEKTRMILRETNNNLSMIRADMSNVVVQNSQLKSNLEDISRLNSQINEQLKHYKTDVKNVD